MALVILLIVIVDSKRYLHLPKYISPFFYYLISIGIIVLCTLISFANYIDISGLFKSIKYGLYIVAICLIAKNNFYSFVDTFNKIAFLSILFTISLYAIQWYNYPGSTGDYFSLTTWDVNYVPSGLSNLNLSLSDFTFSRSAGNHGIYGSYLVLVYILNIHILVSENIKENKFSLILVILAVFNLLLLTSRESILIFVLVNAAFFLKDLLRLRIKKIYFYFFIALSVFLIVIISKGVNLGLINKIQYTIESFSTSGGEQNLNLRFNVWVLILLSYLLFPLHLLIGYGYNEPNFIDYLEQTNAELAHFQHFATVPESLFFVMLAYGGILALISICLFFLTILLKTFNLRKFSPLHTLFFYFVIGLLITNNTGASLMSDLLLAQFSLFYIFINKTYEQDKAVAYNR
ncbi:oligosaccharide repeat unit polymerase [Pontibacter sp. FD36]|uniref:O-antigen ligase family protein n=1 Tax=Pontibacter sp. FD36 TaxID=2789860 RepID=UPI0018AC586C|nr:O-antigen polymerase [Pontibacter sp. FD36]MBF8964584.1 oligosaccharide repeat unit polymerase [Pontibacter sp. FD36]